MAIRVQTKTDESNAAILKLEEELTKKKKEFEVWRFCTLNISDHEIGD
jgi:hypothetical protein